MDSKKPNKITQIVRLQQVLKKWKSTANNASNKNTRASDSSSGSNNKGINKFLKRTLSFTDFSSSRESSSSTSETVPRGFLAVCVGKELKRFIIPTEYLGHQVFQMLLREAEEEFGFQQEGVLKIPCQVSVFERILKVVQHSNNKEQDSLTLQDFGFTGGGGPDKDKVGCYASSSDCEVTPTHHAQVCR